MSLFRIILSICALSSLSYAAPLLVQDVETIPNPTGLDTISDTESQSQSQSLPDVVIPNVLGVLSCPIFCPDNHYAIEYTIFDKPNADCGEERNKVSGARIDAIWAVENVHTGVTLTVQHAVSNADGKARFEILKSDGDTLVRVCIVRIQHDFFIFPNNLPACRFTMPSADGLCPSTPMVIDDQACNVPSDRRITVGFPDLRDTRFNPVFANRIRAFADQSDIVCGEDFRVTIPGAQLLITTLVFHSTGHTTETVSQTYTTNEAGIVDFMSAPYPDAEWAIVCVVKATADGFCLRYPTDACDFEEGPLFDFGSLFP